MDESRLTADDVVETICIRHGIGRSLLFSVRRDRTLIDARRECAVELRKLDMSLPEIGKAMNRDHTTVLYYLRTQ
jgi:chromosomal replication initiation ATPase DnaA